MYWNLVLPVMYFREQINSVGVRNLHVTYILPEPDTVQVYTCMALVPVAL